ncbi:hypothetical protein OSB04_024517 [Centaurea solstitialis]|uniref:Tf2-1-like SH3-like domain-containing protein n=1 Tax=Centaurea solstitialis TaxID=347529 RepID=A0AA38SYK7_9ASTR|nr:hypothetical protein OSB04_024517 [Centaurea solstitialis]
MLNISPRKGVVRFGNRGKLSLSYVGPFSITERIGEMAYKVELPEGLRGIHNTFHVSNLRKCLADVSLVVRTRNQTIKRKRAMDGELFGLPQKSDTDYHSPIRTFQKSNTDYLSYCQIVYIQLSDSDYPKGRFGRHLSPFRTISSESNYLFRNFLKFGSDSDSDYLKFDSDFLKVRMRRFDDKNRLLNFISDKHNYVDNEWLGSRLPTRNRTLIEDGKGGRKNSEVKEPEAILDRKISRLRSKDIVLVKVQQGFHKGQEAILESKEEMRTKYTDLFA